MSAAASLGLAAGLLQAAAYVIYVRQVVSVDGRPNGMTWLMWSYGSLVFFAIELHLGAPTAVLVLPAVCTLCSIGVSVYAFARGSYIPPERQDWVALAIDLAVTLGYVAFVGLAMPRDGAVDPIGLAFVAIAGATSLTSSWPILRTTYMDPANERPLAWFVWSAAFGLLSLAAMAEGLAWPFLVYPVLSQVISMLIGILALEAPESRPAGDSAV